jgi:hypothetical protein
MSFSAISKTVGLLQITNNQQQKTLCVGIPQVCAQNLFRVKKSSPCPQGGEVSVHGSWVSGNTASISLKLGYIMSLEYP